MLKVGIICAIEREAEAFLLGMEDRVDSEKAMLKFSEGKINGLNVAVVCCGVGKTNAALATQLMIDLYGINLIINSGTAGGMDSRLELFDAVVANDAAHHDIKVDMLAAEAPLIYFKSDKMLLELTEKAIKVLSLRNKVYFGTMISGEKFVTDEGREELMEAFFPMSVDMETASVAQVCYVNKIPVVAIRAITDTADHSGMENFEKNCEKAAEVAAVIVLELLNEIKMFYHS